MSDGLQQLARSYGVQTRFRDGLGRWHRPGEETLTAVLRSLGAELDEPAQADEALRRRRRELAGEIVPPVIVAWDGRLDELELQRPTAAATAGRGRAASRRALFTITSEGGAAERVERSLDEAVPASPRDRSQGTAGVDRAAEQTVRVSLGLRLPPGYHSLVTERGGRVTTSLVVAAPRRCPSAPAPAWGVFLPLYALRTEDDWGLGDLGDLRTLREWVAELGGSLVSTLPLFAAFVTQPGPVDPSPYLPVSRLFWNEAYLDIPALPEAALDAVRPLLESEAVTAELAALRRAGIVDFVRVVALKRRVVEACAAALETAPRRAAAFDSWLAAHPDAGAYARFRAWREQEGRRAGASDAPSGGPGPPEADLDPVRVRYHAYSQWALTQQLDALDGAGAGSALDLPLGVHPRGFDVWSRRAAFAQGVHVGAPPDALMSEGQEWGFPPLHPVASRASGYEYLIACLRTVLPRCRLLRLDHVMGLHRQYFVPRGMPAHAGTYVRSPAEELYAVLALEASKTGTVLVGEDIGTVPDEVRRAMRRHGVLRMHVLEAEAPPDEAGPVELPGGDALAALNTHDLPSFAAWWREADLERAAELGLIDPPSLAAERERRVVLREALARESAEAPAGPGASDRRAGVSERTAGVRPSAGSSIAPQRLREIPDEELRRILRRALLRLAGSDAPVLLVALEDLWLETAPVNVPGADLAVNWRRRARLSFASFSESPETVGVLAEVAARRGEAGS